jgi:hypothetical protein
MILIFFYVTESSFKKNMTHGAIKLNVLKKFWKLQIGKEEGIMLPTIMVKNRWF